MRDLVEVKDDLHLETSLEFDQLMRVGGTVGAGAAARTRGQHAIQAVRPCLGNGRLFEPGVEPSRADFSRRSVIHASDALLG